MWGFIVTNSASVATSWACGARCALLSLSTAHTCEAASLAVSHNKKLQGPEHEYIRESIIPGNVGAPIAQDSDTY